MGQNPMPSLAIETLNIRLGFVPKRSFFPHPGVLADVAVILASYHVAVYLGSEKRLPHGILSVATAAVVFLTTRWRALFALPLLLAGLNLLIGWAVKPNRKRHLFASVLLLALATGVVGVLRLAQARAWGFRPAEVSPVDRSQEPTTVREAVFAGAIEITQQRGGLGAGFGMFGSPASVTYHYSPLYYHFGINELWRGSADDPSFITDQWWSWYLGEIGLWGMLAYLAFLGGLMWLLVKLLFRQRGGSSLLRGLAGAGVAILIYGIGVGFAGSIVSGPPNSYYAFGLVGMALSIERAL